MDWLGGEARGDDGDEGNEADLLHGANGAGSWGGTGGAPEEGRDLDAPAGSGSAHLLSYERGLVSELLDEDALVVMASGLGWHKVVAVLLRLSQHAATEQAQQQEQATAAAGPGAGGASRGGGCVLVLGAQPWQRALICSELARHDPGLPLPLDITNEVPALERIHLYRAPGGRPLFVTARILVVDLLAHRLSGADVEGMLVLNAHRVTDTSGEGFAVALYRSAAAHRPGAAPGWLRAFSDQPTAFSQGFNKVGDPHRPAGRGRVVGGSKRQDGESGRGKEGGWG